MNSSVVAISPRTIRVTRFALASESSTSHVPRFPNADVETWHAGAGGDYSASPTTVEGKTRAPEPRFFAEPNTA